LQRHGIYYEALKEGRKALFVWRKFEDDSGQKGINCSIFRNESDILSSDLIREADAIVDFLQVFMHCLYSHQQGKTFYQIAVEKGVQKLLPEAVVG